MNHMIRVSFAGVREFPVTSLIADKFYVRPVGWLQRLLWRLLVRLGATQQVVEQVDTVCTNYVIDTNDVIREIAEQCSYLNNEERKNPLRVIMGRDKFTRLVGANYRAQMEYGVILSEEPKKIMGLEITIVPWMTGIIVLP